MKIVGIDPGVTGALASIIDGRLDEVIDLPVLNGKIDGRELWEIMSFYAQPGSGIETKVYLEDVHAMPNGVLSSFSMGRSMGTIETAVRIAGLPLIRVSPQAWKRTFNLHGKGRDPDAGRQLAMDLYPTAVAALRRKKDHNRAEAILIARHGVFHEIHEHNKENHEATA